MGIVIHIESSEPYTDDRTISRRVDPTLQNPSDVLMLQLIKTFKASKLINSNEHRPSNILGNFKVSIISIERGVIFSGSSDKVKDLIIDIDPQVNPLDIQYFPIILGT